uniref:DUF4220 domain-containing protein n=1 Tax=Leersia perrieri TaxID=77586 RepID=A0A0D9Y046_9ORYZ
MATHADPIDDSRWEEVRSINSYALFMGYMSMAVKGLGYLVVSWTTVILLGGFVSVLGNKDFWSLSVITLVQTAGVFDVFLNEKLGYIGKSFSGFLWAKGRLGTKSRRRGNDVMSWLYGESYWPRSYHLKDVAVWSVWLLHMLVFGTILCPLALLYMFGLIITAALSVWRLIQRDYVSDPNNSNSANLEPALNVVYCIALLQGVLFSHRFALRFARNQLVRKVVRWYKLDDDMDSKLVMAYLRETKIGCEKNPSFVKGRNLVTYAVGLITKSGSSRDDFIAGARILGTILKNGPKSESHGEMIKQLILSTAAASSSSQVLENLMKTVDSSTTHILLGAETREHAARIVAFLADDLRLEQFPRGIHSIASLLEGPRDDDRNFFPVDYKQLMLHGLDILQKLAAHDGDYLCQAIFDTEGLLAKIMAPLRSGLLHDEDNGSHNGAWDSTVRASLKVMRRLVSAPGEIGKQLRLKISADEETVHNLGIILRCQKCAFCAAAAAASVSVGAYLELEFRASKDLLMLHALDIYTQLHEHTLCNRDKREFLVNNLLSIFTRRSYMRDNNGGMAEVGQMLATLCSHGKENASLILNMQYPVIEFLTEELVRVNYYTNKRFGKNYGTNCSAAKILEQLCIQHIDDGEHLKNLKEALIVMVPKVLVKTLCGSRRTDREMLTAVLSLWVTMSRTLMNAEDLPPLINAISKEATDLISIIGELQSMVKEMEKKYTYVTIVERLKILKLVTEILIQIIKYGNPDAIQDTRRLMQSLHNTAMTFSDIEEAIVISGRSSSRETLGSIVKKAEEELNRREPTHELQVVN